MYQPELRPAQLAGLLRVMNIRLHSPIEYADGIASATYQIEPTLGKDRIPNLRAQVRLQENGFVLEVIPYRFSHPLGDYVCPIKHRQFVMVSEDMDQFQSEIIKAEEKFQNLVTELSKQLPDLISKEVTEIYEDYLQHTLVRIDNLPGKKIDDSPVYPPRNKDLK